MLSSGCNGIHEKVVLLIFNRLNYVQIGIEKIMRIKEQENLKAITQCWELKNKLSQNIHLYLGY